MKRPIIFSIPGYEHLQEALLARLDAERGDVERRQFADGERYQRLMQAVEGRQVILVGGTIDDPSTLTLYDLACAITKYGARRLQMVLPYFGYSTMERAVHSGEVVTAKARARLLSAIPPASYGNSVFLLDLHSEGIPHYFEDGLTAIHVYAKALLTPVIAEMGGQNFVLGSTDAGRAKWIESLANDLGVDAAFIIKRRTQNNQTRVTAMNADVVGRTVVIYDDMIRSGGSLISAAETYQAAGATKQIAVCTHGVFTPGAYRRILDSGLFEMVIATDSHPNAIQLKTEGLVVVETADLFAEHLALSFG